MRSAFLLVGGFVLLAGGIAVIALDVPGRWALGPALVVVGVALKTVGLLRDPQVPAASGGRTKTTLGTAPGPSPSLVKSRADVARRQTGQVSWR